MLRLLSCYPIRCPLQFLQKRDRFSRGKDIITPMHGGAYVQNSLNSTILIKRGIRSSTNLCSVSIVFYKRAIVVENAML